MAKTDTDVVYGKDVPFRKVAKLSDREKVMDNLSVNCTPISSEAMDALYSWVKEVCETFTKVFQFHGGQRIMKLIKRYNNSRVQRRVVPISREWVRRSIKHLPKSVVERIAK